MCSFVALNEVKTQRNGNSLMLKQYTRAQVSQIPKGSLDFIPDAQSGRNRISDRPDILTTHKALLTYVTVVIVWTTTVNHIWVYFTDRREDDAIAKIIMRACHNPNT